MKLVCAVVLALGTVVAASPYGYGVKGGASAAAKAESSAAAAPVPGIAVVPLSIPSGAGGSYTGSFSKSSSSSFASSSASSSSGSFAYSGSGIVPSGYSVNGISGNTKCSSGNCPTGNYGTTGVGTGDNGYTGAYSGANAAAGAGAIVVPGSHANNAECSGNICKPVCEGDSCGANTNTVTTNTDKKCASGNCNVPALTSSSTSAGHGSNDIYVSTQGSQISGDNPSNKPFTGSASACTYGNCSPTASTETKLSYPSPSNTHPSTTVQVTKPLPSLEAPKEDKQCTSPNCGSSSYNKEKPSSYNVPVYSQNITPCYSGNCGDSEPHSTTLPAAPSKSTSAVCAGGNCGNSNKPTPGFPSKTTSNSANDYPDFVPLVPTGSPVKPVYTQSVPTHAPLVPTGAAPTGSYSKPNDYGPPKPLAPVAPTSENKIPYTGGFGGPPGFLKPNEFTAPSSISSTNYKPDLPTGSHNYPPAPTGPSTPIHLTPCTSGNCGPSPPSYKPAVPTTSYPTPGQSTSTNYQNGLPSNSQYKPTKPNNEGCIFGNCGIQSSQSPPSQQENSGSYKPSESYSPNGETGAPRPPSPIFCTSGNCGGQPQPSPSTPTASYSPTGCSSGNCGSQPHYSTPQFGQSGSYKPSLQSNKPSNTIETNKPLCTSGNCGSQPLPHFDSSISSSPHGSGPSYNPTASPGSYNPSCPSGNCGIQPSQAIPQHGQNPSYKPLPPTGAYNPSGSYNANGCITGNCGAPPPPPLPSQFGQGGLYKPAGPPNSYTPTGTSIGSYGQTGCASGACESPVHTSPQHVSSGSSYNPSIPTGSPGLTTCSSGNCGSYPSQQKPTDTYNHGLNNPSGCSSGNCQLISPGSQFDRPLPVLHKPSGPSESYNPGCSSGNCAGSFSKPATPVFGAPAGILKPNEFPHVYNHGLNNPSGCSSGNCQLISPGSQFDRPLPVSHKPSGPLESYNPGCSSGNCAGSFSKPATPVFGAPAGILKPNEFPHVPGSASGQPSISSSVANPSCSSGKCVVQPGLITGSHAIAGAAASANEVLYMGGFGGPPGLLQPYDGGKVPIGPQASGSHTTGNFGSSQGTGVHSSYEKSLNGVFTPGAAGNAQASAVTGAAASSYGGSKSGGNDYHGTGGCKGGCGDSTGMANAGGAAYSASTAKAAGGAYGGSYASSSASAHAYAGAATKGGYGKR